MKDYLKEFTLRMIIPTIIVLGLMLKYNTQIQGYLPKLVENIPVSEVGQDVGKVWMQPVKVKKVVGATTLILDVRGEGEREVTLTGVSSPDKGQSSEALDYVRDLLPEGVDLYMEREGHFERESQECYLWILDEIDDDFDYVKGYMINGVLLDEGVVDLATDAVDGKYHSTFKRIYEDRVP